METAILRRDEASLAANRAAAARLANLLAAAGHPLKGAEQARSGWLLRDVPADPILVFLAAFRNHDGSYHSDPRLVRPYIEDRRDAELARWDVLFASLQENGADAIDESLGVPIYCQRRTAGKRSNLTTLFITNKQRVASRGVESTGLDDADIEAAQAAYRRSLGLNVDGKQPVRSINYPDRIYRPVRIRPLLIIHLLKIKESNPRAQPIVAWSISFPATKMEEKRVEYVVNTRWMRENFGDDLNEEEMGGDNE